MEEKIINIVKQISGIEDVKINTDLQSIGVSSIHFIEIIIEVEKIYQKRIPDELMSWSRLNTIYKIEQLMASLG